jgi:UDP-N-acetyl-D-mannosaminuronic acid dehydrogenase
MSTISILGLGYIGLPTACMFAQSGNQVYGIDINKDVVASINKGIVHIVEPGLDTLLRKVVDNKKLVASDRIQEPTNVYIIAVPTPFKGNFEPDISYVEAAALSIAPVLKMGDLIILESTSPVGTTRHISELLAIQRQDLQFPHVSDKPDIHLAYCPERILPGKALEELVANDRVIGGLTPECAEKASVVYRTFVKGQCFSTNAETAEMSKLTENAYRDVNVAFANELSIICDELKINVWDLIEFANHHPRVNILKPGPGVGGHCIAVDPWFIYSKTPQLAPLIKAARDVNDGKPHFVLQKVMKKAQKIAANKVSFYGLSFKPNIDDLRESPSVEIVKNYAEKNKDQQIYVVEPHIQELPKILSSYGNIQLKSFDEGLKADIVALLVGHDAFLAGKQKISHHPVILDFQGIMGS